MMESFNEKQARIDSLFADLGKVGPSRRVTPSSAAEDRVLGQAKRGVIDPDSLSRTEMQEICSALVVHYAQMGIG